MPLLPRAAVRRMSLAVAMVTLMTAAGCLGVPLTDPGGGDGFLGLGGGPHPGQKTLDDGTPFVGAWLGEWPNKENGAIDAFEEDIGRGLDVVDVYLDWFTPVANVTDTVAHISDSGAVPSLTWEPQTLTTTNILQGGKELPLRDGRRVTVDEYLSEFVDGLCATTEDLDSVVLMRLMQEPNGGWFSWGTSFQTANGDRPNTPESYQAAWRKVHDAFENECPGAIRFVWAVNHFSVGRGASFTNTFPGDDVVDYVAIDGYNWGTEAPWGWQDLDTIFRAAYCAVTGVTDKPLYFAETGSLEAGGSKAEWINDLYASRDRYPRLQGIVWLNHEKYEIEIDRKVDWRIQSSPEATEAFAAGAESWGAVRPEDMPTDLHSPRC